MSSHRRACVRELTSAAYELDSGVIEGRLRYDQEKNCWMIGQSKLIEWIAEYGGQEVALIVASLEDDRPIPPKVCRTCGDEYIGIECPRCREARIRLRGY